MSEDSQRMLDMAHQLSRALKPGDLEETLSSITRAAVGVLPQVQYASITVVHDDGRVDSVVPTDQLLVELDQAQAELREGPCFQAAVEMGNVVSSHLAADDRFPRYGPVAVSAGIRSQAGLRLFDAAKSQGSLNLYSKSPGAFEDTASLAGLFAHHAAVAIGYAREVGNLREALETRTMIGQAVGIAMERYGLTDDRAFAFLARLSQQRNVKLRLLAQELIAASDARGAEDEGTEPGDPR